MNTKFLLQESSNTYKVNAPLTEDDILSMANEIAKSKLASGITITNAQAIQQYLQTLLQSEQIEKFGVVFLDSQHQIIAVNDSFFAGTLNSAAVYPREIVKSTLMHNAAALVLFHNHPSGLAEPSRADIDITRVIKQALATIDVQVLDHIVVAAKHTVSFAERGLM
jgi:DNA repair protein RadC